MDDLELLKNQIESHYFNLDDFMKDDNLMHKLLRLSYGQRSDLFRDVKQQAMDSDQDITILLKRALASFKPKTPKFIRRVRKEESKEEEPEQEKMYGDDDDVEGRAPRDEDDGMSDEGSEAEEAEQVEEADRDDEESGAEEVDEGEEELQPKASRRRPKAYERAREELMFIGAEERDPKEAGQMAVQVHDLQQRWKRTGLAGPPRKRKPKTSTFEEEEKKAEEELQAIVKRQEAMQAQRGQYVERKKQMGGRQAYLMQRIGTKPGTQMRGPRLEDMPDIAFEPIRSRFEMSFPRRMRPSAFVPQETPKLKLMSWDEISDKITINDLFQLDELPEDLRAFLRGILFQHVYEHVGVSSLSQTAASSLLVDSLIPYHQSSGTKKTVGGKDIYIVKWKYGPNVFRREFENKNQAARFASEHYSYLIQSFLIWDRQRWEQLVTPTETDERQEYEAMLEQSARDYQINEYTNVLLPTYQAFADSYGNLVAGLIDIIKQKPSPITSQVLSWVYKYEKKLQSTRNIQAFLTQYVPKKLLAQTTIPHIVTQARREYVNQNMMAEYGLTSIQQLVRARIPDAVWNMFEGSMLASINTAYQAAVHKYNYLTRRHRLEKQRRADEVLDMDMVAEAMRNLSIQEQQPISLLRQNEARYYKLLENEAMKLLQERRVGEPLDQIAQLVMEQIVMLETSIAAQVMASDEKSPKLMQYMRRFTEPLLYLMGITTVSPFAQYFKTQLREGKFQIIDAPSWQPVDYFPEFFLSHRDPATLKKGHDALELQRELMVRELFKLYLSLIRPTERLYDMKIITKRFPWEKYVQANIGEQCEQLESGWDLVPDPQNPQQLLRVPTGSQDIVIAQLANGQYRCYAIRLVTEAIRASSREDQVLDPYQEEKRRKNPQLPQTYLPTAFVQRIKNQFM